MLDRKIVEEQIPHALKEIDLSGLGDKIGGKVRDCYVQGDTRILIASDRLSAFDVILDTIPFKGQILTELAMHWFKLTEHIVPNHIISHPHPNVMVTREVEIVPVEVIIRGYITGSAWRDYQAGKAVSGVTLPAGLKKSQKFDSPIITPSTKAAMGDHDEPISCEEIVSSGLVEESLWNEIADTAMKLFAFGTEKAAEQGLILVDTKYEFGVLKDESGKNQLILADEVHTSDSSRYWVADSYSERYEAGEDPVMLDKEFVRRQLIELGFMGEGTPPQLTDDFKTDTAMKYIEAFERLTGLEFKPKSGPVADGIDEALTEFKR